VSLSIVTVGDGSWGFHDADECVEKRERCHAGDSRGSLGSMGWTRALVVGVVAVAVTVSGCEREPNEVHAELRDVSADANSDRASFSATESWCQWSNASTGGSILGIGGSASRARTTLKASSELRVLEIDFWETRLEPKTYVLDETNVGIGDAKKFLVSWNERETAADGTVRTSRTWAAVAGTITVDGADDEELTLHGELRMAPSSAHPDGVGKATGTFTLSFRGAIHDARL
jgi:hypothetical protein